MPNYEGNNWYRIDSWFVTTINFCFEIIKIMIKQEKVIYLEQTYHSFAANLASFFVTYVKKWGEGGVCLIRVSSTALPKSKRITIRANPFKITTLYLWKCFEKLFIRLQKFQLWRLTLGKFRLNCLLWVFTTGNYLRCKVIHREDVKR